MVKAAPRLESEDAAPTRRSRSILLLFLAGGLAAAAPAWASARCSSVLTADQVGKLDSMVFPGHPYSPHLGEAVDADSAQGTVKRLTTTDVETLRGAIARPYTGAVRDFQSQDEVAELKAWLTANPSAEFPAWNSAAAEPNLPWAWVPRGWLGRMADDFLHLVKEAGDAGPIKGTTLGAAMSVGRTLGVTHHVAADSSGHDMLVWSYIYRATVGGRLLTTLLAICQADVATMSSDERDLRVLEQQLARAWAARDRTTIEHLLAREWSVTTSDGAVVSRAAALGATFDANAQIIESMTTDDDVVTVTRFDAAAVVRGRTVATIWFAGVRETKTFRFTDFLIKRDGTWQIVASHQTNVVP
jgi:hypothetical protein